MLKTIRSQALLKCKDDFRSALAKPDKSIALRSVACFHEKKVTEVNRKVPGRPTAFNDVSP